MIRVAHSADIHFGAGTAHGSLDADGVHLRLKDFRRVWLEVCRGAVEREVDLFVFAGDGFRTRKPTPTEQAYFLEGLRIVERAGIPALLLAGNHDLGPAQGEATALDVFATSWSDLGNTGHRLVVRHPRIVNLYHELTGGPGGGCVLQVVCVPYFSRSHLLAAEALEGADVEEVNGIASELGDHLVHSLAAQLDPNLPAIAAVHHNLSGAVTSTGWETASFADPILPVSAFAHGPWSYTAAGHIHKLQDLSPTERPVVYPGSLERVDFGEEREPKGWCYVEIDDDGRATWEHVPVSARKFRTVEVDLTGDEWAVGDLLDSPQERLLRCIRAAEVRDAVVRLRYRVHRGDLPGISVQALREALRAGGAWHVDRPGVEVVDPDRPVAVQGLSQGVDPETAVRAYVEASDDLRPDAEALMGAYREVWAEVAGEAAPEMAEVA